MLRLDEIKTGDRIVVRKSGILSFVEVVSTDAERISTDDGRMWNRDDGTCVFWQSHFDEGQISQDPVEWEWLKSKHRNVEAEEIRAKAKDVWLKTNSPGRKKRR